MLMSRLSMSRRFGMRRRVLRRAHVVSGVILGEGRTGCGRAAGQKQEVSVSHGMSVCSEEKGYIGRASIHSAMPTIARFSLSETKPSGTRLLPPTQAHLMSRFWM